MPALLELDHVGLSYHTLSGEIQALSQISFPFRKASLSLWWGPADAEKVPS